MILAGYEYGKKYIGAPVLGPIVFCICTVMMGILFEYADKAILGPAYIGIISMIPMIIMAVIICVKQKRN